MRRFDIFCGDGAKAALGLITLCISPAALTGAGGEAGPEFGFAEPRVAKLDWSTRALQVADVNGDSLDDLVLINNERMQIEILRQRSPDDRAPQSQTRLDEERWSPEFEDGHFEDSAISVGFPVFDLAVGDLNGDGRVDLAYTARETSLTIRFQGVEGDWLESQDFGGFDSLGWHGTLKLQDLDSDGDLEIVHLAADAVRVFSHSENGQIGQTETYYLTGKNPFNLTVEDLTGDGLMDIAYLSTEGRQSLVLREQLPSGGFGAERRFPLDRPVRMFASMNERGEARPSLVFVDSRGGRLEMLRLTERLVATGAGHPMQGVQALIYPVFGEASASARYAWGDLDGNGSADLVVATAEGSELLFFPKDGQGFAEARAFPTLSSIDSLVTGRFFEGTSAVLVALSQEEQLLGLSLLDSKDRVTFPRLIELDVGEPIVCSALDLDGDGFDELALVVDGESGMELIVAQPERRDDAAGRWTVLSREELGGIRRDPVAMRVLDVFGAQGRGIMLFVPREAPVLLAPEPGADPFALAPVGESSSVRESLLKDVAPSQVSAIDVDGDGRLELVVGRDGFARAIRIEEGRLEMIDQFNARRSDDVVAAVIPSGGPDGLEGLALYVADKGELQYLERDRDGVLRYRETENIGSVELSGWIDLSTADSGGGAAAGHLLLGEDRFYFFRPGGNDWQMEMGQIYETELEDVFFSQVATGDFDRDGFDDIVAVDGSDHVVEILKNSAGGPESLMFWKIFDKNMHYQGRTGAKLEPRETVLADLNADGKLDFAFLIHDRVLFYPQE